jgi:hypothetical protein
MVDKYFTFSIWGDNPKYLQGAIRNAELAEEIFPDWKCVFYYDATVPKETIDKLSLFKNTSVKEVTDDSFGAFWRFEMMFNNPGVILSRDTDSRLSLREKELIDNWLESEYNYMIIRDHDAHYEFPILAGMWGKKNVLMDSSLKDAMQEYVSVKQYLVDQFYLRDKVWPNIMHDTAIYGVKEVDWMRETYDFENKNFIGQTYTENDEPVYDGKI